MTAQDARDGRTDPGGGSALDAAIEAAARAIEAAADEWEATSKGDITRMQADAEYYDLPGVRADDAEPFARVAVRAAEPILRQAVAEQIARRIEANVAHLTPGARKYRAFYAGHRDAAEIAREVGRADR